MRNSLVGSDWYGYPQIYICFLLETDLNFECKNQSLRIKVIFIKVALKNRRYCNIQKKIYLIKSNLVSIP